MYILGARLGNGIEAYLAPAFERGGRKIMARMYKFLCLYPFASSGSIIFNVDEKKEHYSLLL